ncbi:MAG: DUF1127 domain-containing protein [Roseobacter sp.]
MTRTDQFSPSTLAYLSTARTAPAVAVFAVEFAAVVSKWATRRQTRHALKQLSNWQLEDVGLTPLQAQREASKVFWRA